MSVETPTQLQERAELLAEERARREEEALEQALRAAEAAGEKLLRERLAPAFAI